MEKEKINISNEEWMNCLYSTAIRSSYYKWKGDNFILDGERGDERVEILKKEAKLFKVNKVLDIGCNIGRICHFASNYAMHVEGYEQDINTLNAAKKISFIEKKANINFLNRDMRFDPISNADIAICFSVLHHINPRENIFNELNNKISKYIFIETNRQEYAYNSLPTKDEDKWEFENFDAVLNYLLKNLSNFELYKHLGVSDRNRNMFILQHK